MKTLKQYADAIRKFWAVDKQLTYGECAAIALKAREEGRSEEWIRDQVVRRGAAATGASAQTAISYFHEMTLRDLREKGRGF